MFHLNRLEYSDLAGRRISRSFSAMMLTLLGIVALALSAAAGIFRYAFYHAIVTQSAENYARFLGHEVGRLAGSLDDPQFWEIDADGLSAILTRGSRIKGIVSIEIHNPEGQAATSPRS